MTSHAVETKNLLKDIRNYKTNLINKADKSGVYENFGQTEIKKLKDKYINISSYSDYENQKRNSILNFSSWCETYNGGLK